MSRTKRGLRTGARLALELGLAVALSVSVPAQVNAQPTVSDTAAPGPLAGLTLALTLHDRGYGKAGRQIFQDDDGALRPGAEASYDVVHLGDNGRLALGLGIMGDSRGQFGDFTLVQAKLDTVSYYATAIARFRSDAQLQPYLAVAGGLVTGDLTLDSSLHAHALSGFGSGSVGMRIAPRGLQHRHFGNLGALGFALGIEVGGAYGSAFKWKLRASENGNYGVSDPDCIPVQAVPLGALAQQSLFGRLAVMVVF